MCDVEISVAPLRCCLCYGGSSAGGCSDAGDVKQLPERG